MIGARWIALVALAAASVLAPAASAAPPQWRDGDGFDRLRAAAAAARASAERDAITVLRGRLQLEMRFIARHVDDRAAMAIRVSLDGAAALHVKRRPEGWPRSPAADGQRPIAGIGDEVLAQPLVVRAIERFASADEREALERAWRERERRLRDAQFELARVLIGREMRLRAPALEDLSEDLRAWIDADRPGGDIVVQALLGLRETSGWTGDERLLRLGHGNMALRQHRAGRDPALDFALEAFALSRHHGWPAGAAERLVGASVRLGETFRRETGFMPEQRGMYPLRPLLDPGDYPLWVALVEFTGREHGVAPDPGPVLLGDDRALVEARVGLVLAVLRRSALIEGEALAALAPAVRDHVDLELSEAPEELPFVAPGEVLARLRLVPGGRPLEGAGSRRALVDAIARVVDDTQARALSIDR